MWWSVQRDIELLVIIIVLYDEIKCTTYSPKEIIVIFKQILVTRVSSAKDRSTVWLISDEKKQKIWSLVFKIFLSLTPAKVPFSFPRWLQKFASRRFYSSVSPTVPIFVVLPWHLALKTAPNPIGDTGLATFQPPAVIIFANCRG